MDCKNTDLYGSLDWCQGEVIIPGIRQRVYYIPKRHIVKWPVLPATGEKAADIVTYKGDFLLAADKKWLGLDVLSDKSPVTSETQGEIPSVTTLNKATFKHPGVKTAVTAFAKQANNDDLVYLIETKEGEFRVLGNRMFNTSTKVNTAIGGSATDDAGTTIEIEITDLCPAPFYVGNIETEAGDIDASNGDKTPETPEPENP